MGSSGSTNKEKYAEEGFESSTGTYTSPSISEINNVVVRKVDDDYDDFYARDDKWYSKLQMIAGKLGVEERGIERVPEDERTDTSGSKMATMVS